MSFYEILQDIAKNDNIEMFVVGAVITNSTGEVLLVMRKKDDFMGGFYEIPGGTSEDNETLYETLVKGVKEETGLDVIGVESYIGHFDYLSKNCKKCRQFDFKVIVSSYKEILLTEHDRYKWSNLDELEKETKITPKVKHEILTYVFNERQKNTKGNYR
jgi:8-oxo-dGTP diphosphatase